jgi:hypothetical protein
MGRDLEALEGEAFPKSAPQSPTHPFWGEAGSVDAHPSQ